VGLFLFVQNDHNKTDEMRAKLKIVDRNTGMNSMQHVGSRFFFTLPSPKAEENIVPICNLSIVKNQKN
jgi:hypothetical protein